MKKILFLSSLSLALHILVACGGAVDENQNRETSISDVKDAAPDHSDVTDAAEEYPFACYVAVCPGSRDGSFDADANDANDANDAGDADQ